MKVLIAEDDIISCKILEKNLIRWGYEVVTTTNGGEALEIMQSKTPPDIAILDWIMPEIDGIDICQRIRKEKIEPYIYIIILTALSQGKYIIEGLAAGADDYITKPYYPHELKVRLEAGMRIIELQRDLIKTRDMLQIQATHDPLTGVLNRGAIFERLEEEICRAKREECPIGVILADIDHFKNINDTYGHAIGDTVLCKVTEYLKTSLRPYDSIGRYGGEEFLIIVPGTDQEYINHVAKRLCAGIKEEHIRVPNELLKLTISWGVTLLTEVTDENTDLLIKTADKALYKAKNLGRDRVEFLSMSSNTVG